MERQLRLLGRSVGRQVMRSRRGLALTRPSRLIKEGGEKTLPVVGYGHGNTQDPTFWTWDKTFEGERTDFYREEMTHGWQQNAYARFVGVTLIAYVTWQFYWRYPAHTGGHFSLPDPEDFTDSELGIPPDDAPDPAYWGDKLPGYPNK